MWYYVESPPHGIIVDVTGLPGWHGQTAQSLVVGVKDTGPEKCRYEPISVLLTSMSVPLMTWVGSLATATQSVLMEEHFPVYAYAL